MRPKYIVNAILLAIVVGLAIILFNQIGGMKYVHVSSMTNMTSITTSDGKLVGWLGIREGQYAYDPPTGVGFSGKIHGTNDQQKKTLKISRTEDGTLQYTVTFHQDKTQEKLIIDKIISS